MNMNEPVYQPNLMAITTFWHGAFFTSLDTLLAGPVTELGSGMAGLQGKLPTLTGSSSVMMVAGRTCGSFDSWFGGSNIEAIEIYEQISNQVLWFWEINCHSFDLIFELIGWYHVLLRVKLTRRVNESMSGILLHEHIFPIVPWN